MNQSKTSSQITSRKTQLAFKTTPDNNHHKRAADTSNAFTKTKNFGTDIHRHTVEFSKNTHTLSTPRTHSPKASRATVPAYPSLVSDARPDSWGIKPAEPHVQPRIPACEDRVGVRRSDSTKVTPPTPPTQIGRSRGSDTRSSPMTSSNQVDADQVNSASRANLRDQLGDSETS